MKLNLPTREHYDALVQALDEYVANQSEYEDVLGQEESPKLRAARELVDVLNAPIIALAEKP